MATAGTTRSAYYPKGRKARSNAYPYRRQKRPTKRKSAKKQGNFVTQSFTVLNATVSVANAAAFAEEFTPSLSNIEAGDLAAYTALYDEFRVTSITIDVQPNVVVNTNTSAGTTSDTNLIRMYSVLDKTDSTPITIAQAMQYNNVQKRLSNVKHCIYRKYAPMVPILIQDLNQNYMMQLQKSPWMQLSPQVIGGNNYDNTLIAYPGVKAISDINTGDPLEFDVFITLVVQFRVKL